MADESKFTFDLLYADLSSMQHGLYRGTLSGDYKVSTSQLTEHPDKYSGLIDAATDRP